MQINEIRVWTGWIVLTWKNRTTRWRLVLASLRSSQNPQGVAANIIRVPEVGGRRLTRWPIARHNSDATGFIELVSVRLIPSKLLFFSRTAIELGHVGRLGNTPQKITNNATTFTQPLCLESCQVKSYLPFLMLPSCSELTVSHKIAIRHDLSHLT